MKPPVYLMSSFRGVPGDLVAPVYNIHPNYVVNETELRRIAETSRGRYGLYVLDVELGKKQSPVYQRLATALGREGFTWSDQTSEPYVSIVNNTRCESVAMFARIAPDLKQVSYLGGDLLESAAAVAQLDNLWSPDRNHKGVLRHGSGIMAEVYRSKGNLKDWMRWEPDKIKRLRANFPGPIYVGFEVRNWINPGIGDWRSADELLERWRSVESYADGVILCDFYFADAAREFDPAWGWVKFIEELRK
jgi:hypothetical protein